MVTELAMLFASMRTNYHRTWTAEDDEQIRKLAAAKKAALFIAARVKRTMMSVRRWANELGVELPKRIRSKPIAKSGDGGR
jgi:hypothetical protein